MQKRKYKKARGQKEWVKAGIGQQKVEVIDWKEKERKHGQWKLI